MGISKSGKLYRFLKQSLSKRIAKSRSLMSVIMKNDYSDVNVDVDQYFQPVDFEDEEEEDVFLQEMMNERRQRGGNGRQGGRGHLGWMGYR